MRIKECNYDDIIEIHKAVFVEDLSKSKVLEKKKKGVIWFYHLIENKEIIGYVSLQSRDKTCHIWMTGLLPQFRGQGLGKKLYSTIEEHAKRIGFFRITLSTHNDIREMLALAIKNEYRIVKTERGEYGDKIKIRLEKQINFKNELRILLTEKCNYKCFFCHSEGLDAKADYSKNTKENIFNRITEAMELGFNDITFTGGEPLIRYKDVIYLLNECNKLTEAPKITIVTNGSLVNDEIIFAISNYKGEFKFNLSIHCLEPEIYTKITKVNTKEYYNVVGNIRKLTRKGIRVKLNCVILKNINTENIYLESHLKTAYELGVDTVKFLELLVIKDNQEFYKYFYSANTICTKLKEISCLEKTQNMRGSTFTHPKYNNLKIEVMKCTCKLGCSNCMDIRDRTLGPDLNYYPCFVQSDKPVFINQKRGVKAAFEKGNIIINGYARKFKNDSPILIAQDNYLKTRSEIFFKTDLSFDECNNILENNGFKHSKTRAFSLFYYRPISLNDEWIKFHKILKYGYDSHTPNKIEFIYSNHKYSQTKDNLFLEEQKFIDGLLPPYCNNVELAESIMDALDFEKYFSFDYEIVDFKKNDILISLDRKSKTVNFKIKYQDLNSETWKRLLKDLNAEMITEPFTKWFVNINIGE